MTRGPRGVLFSKKSGPWAAFLFVRCRAEADSSIMGIVGPGREAH